MDNIEKDYILKNEELELKNEELELKNKELELKNKELELKNKEYMYNNSRIVKLEKNRLFRIYEKFMNNKNQPYSVILRKIIKKIVPKIIPTFLKRYKTKQIMNELAQNKNNKILLVFPIIAWGFRWQRPQHLLSRLAKKGYTIIYISKVFITNKRTGNEEVIDSIELEKLDENIYKIHLISLKNLNIYKDTLSDKDISLFASQVNLLLDLFKGKKIVYFVQFPNWINLVKKLKSNIDGKIVFDCMDEHSGFSNIDKQIIEHEHELVKISDMVISSSNKLFIKNKLQNKNTIMIKNGTEFEFFATKQETNELETLTTKPMIGYYGAIADWFDIELIEYCAMKRPQYNFVLIGSTFNCNIESAKQIKNIYFLGEKNYKDLPRYLYKFDVCTIPFQIIPLIEATNPVKFYEYISAGKPVVSTKLPELEEFKDICYLAENKEEFLNMLDKALVEKEFDDFEQLVQKRINIAKENSWDNRVEVLDKNLKEQ